MAISLVSVDMDVSTAPAGSYTESADVGSGKKIVTGVTAGRLSVALVKYTSPVGTGGAPVLGNSVIGGVGS